MLLPTVTEFSVGSSPDRYADCSRAIGLANTGDSDEVANEKLIQGLYSYNDEMAVPTMSEFGIDRKEFEDALDQMADDALRSGAPNNNPRIPDKQEIRDLFLQAWA